MTDKQEWQGRVGDTWAEEWRRTDRAFGPVTEALLAQTRALKFTQVLDIGCGAGELSLALSRGRPDCEVTGIDVSPALLAIARQRAANRGNLSFVECDAAAWEAGGQPPELLISRHGVMFFDEPTAAFGNLARQSAKRSELLFSCFRSAQENPFHSEIVRLLPEPPGSPDPYAPGPFAFADRDHVSGILCGSGWEPLSFEAFDFGMVVGSGDEPLADAVRFFSRIGPGATAARQMEEAQRERFLARVAETVKRYLLDNLVVIPAAAWIVSARKVD